MGMDLDQESKNKFRNLIEDKYFINWIVDNLPASTPYDMSNQEVKYFNGFPVGYDEKGYYFVYNHVTLSLKYHADPDTYSGYRIVGFEVIPKSLVQAVQDAPEEPSGFKAYCNTGTEKHFDIDKH